MIDRPFRFIADDGRREPRLNLAVDEALARAAGPEPTLRLWRNERCVILGRFQLADAEVDLEAADRLGVPLYRRFTGGGAVYQDAGNLNISLAAPRNHPMVEGWLRGLQGLYDAILLPLAAAVGTFGIPAQPARRGLFVGGRKLGGIAAWVGGRRVLVHATLLVDADLVALEQVLAGPGDPGSPRWQRTKSERALVTSLARELDEGAAAAGSSPTRRELNAVVDRAVVQAFRAMTSGPRGAPIEADGLRPPELAVAADLLRSRYAEPGWHACG
jgi:lipoate-protein ligase A